MLGEFKAGSNPRYWPVEPGIQKSQINCKDPGPKLKWSCQWGQLAREATDELDLNSESRAGARALSALLPKLGTWSRREGGSLGIFTRWLLLQLSVQFPRLFLLPLISWYLFVPIAVRVASPASSLCFLLTAQQAHWSCWGPLLSALVLRRSSVPFEATTFWAFN